MDKNTLVLNFLITFVAAYLAVSLFTALHRPPQMPMPSMPVPSPQMGQPMPPAPPVPNQPQVSGPQMLAPPHGQQMPPKAEK